MKETSCPECGTVIMENGFGAPHSAVCSLSGKNFNGEPPANKGVTISKNELERKLNEIKEFNAEIDKLNEHLSAIAPGAVCDFGGMFLDAHIRLLSEYLGDTDEWISWWTFENDFGKKGMRAGYDGKAIKIDRISRLWDLIEEGKERA